MRRRPVQSEAVNSIGYGRMTLEVEFHDRRVYQYFPVPEVTYRELIGAEAIGNFVADQDQAAFQGSPPPDPDRPGAQRRLTFLCSPISVAGWPVRAAFTEP